MSSSHGRLACPRPATRTVLPELLITAAKSRPRHHHHGWPAPHPRRSPQGFMTFPQQIRGEGRKFLLAGGGGDRLRNQGIAQGGDTNGHSRGKGSRLYRLGTSPQHTPPARRSSDHCRSKPPWTPLPREK